MYYPFARLARRESHFPNESTFTCTKKEIDTHDRKTSDVVAPLVDDPSGAGRNRSIMPQSRTRSTHEEDRREHAVDPSVNRSHRVTPRCYRKARAYVFENILPIYVSLYSALSNNLVYTPPDILLVHGHRVRGLSITWNGRSVNRPPVPRNSKSLRLVKRRFVIIVVP